MDIPGIPQRRVSIRDLAKGLGLSHATVSMALRNHPLISEATKQKVRDEAGKRGYRPDPMLSVLASYRQEKKPQQYHGTMAWLLNKISSKELFSIPLFKRYYDGACAKANALGFQVEEFIIDNREMSPFRMSEILLARGIQGILVAPQAVPEVKMEMHWNWFSAVTFGHSLADPQLHTVGSTQYRIAMGTTRKMQELGYKRIGFFGSDRFDQRTDHNFSAGFHIASLDIPERMRVPPLFVRHGSSKSRIFAQVHEWVKQWGIDAIVCTEGMQPILLEAGYKVPRDFAVATVSWRPDEPFFAGMDEQGLLIGAAAVDCIVGMIHRGERGIPEVPYRLMIEGRWRDGESAPPI